MKAFQVIFAVIALPQVILGDLAGDLQANGLTTLLNFVVEAGLAEALGGLEPVTVFAPTNEAFAKLPQETVAALTANDNELLKKVLLYHVIPGAAIKSTDLADDNKVTTASGAPLRVNVYPKGYYHKLVTANGKRVIKADVMAGAGSVVHVIEDVLPFLEEGDNIATVLTNDPQKRFGTLLAAVGAADLAGALSSEDSVFTVFAPTDEAFSKIPAETLDFLLQPENKQALTDILLRHVVPQPLFSKALCWKTYATLNPKDSLKTQTYRGGIVKVVTQSNSAMVEEADLVATNGVIHAIDTVV